MGALNLDISGIEIAFDGLPPGFVTKLVSDWALFVTKDVADPLLRVRVEIADPGALETPFAPQTLTSRLAGGGGEFSLPGGRAVLSADGQVRVELHSASRESHFNLVNLLIACLAVRLPLRSALLVHAACLVVEGRAYLLVGSSGVGKSTWANLGLEAGARSIGDDVVLVERREALGSPFRSRHLAGRAEPGRWPIAALMFPHHGSDASRTRAQRLLARARLTANLPFVTAAGRRDAATEAIVDDLVDNVPCFDLTFARDTSFMPLLNERHDD